MHFLCIPLPVVAHFFPGRACTFPPCNRLQPPPLRHNPRVPHHRNAGGHRGEAEDEGGGHHFRADAGGLPAEGGAPLQPPARVPRPPGGRQPGRRAAAPWAGADAVWPLCPSFPSVECFQSLLHFWGETQKFTFTCVGGKDTTGKAQSTSKKREKVRTSHRSKTICEFQKIFWSNKMHLGVVKFLKLNFMAI